MPPNPGQFTLVGDEPKQLGVIPGIAIVNPADKPWGPLPDEGEAGQYEPRGIVELPLLGGGSPRGSGPAPSLAGPPAALEAQTGPKPLSAYGSPSTSPSGQPLPPKIGSFPVPDNLIYGTTLYGNYAHQQTVDILDDIYPRIDFTFRLRPGQRGVDVEIPDDFVSVVGSKFLEIKPLTPSGERSFNEQVERWGIGPVQALTYDSAGNLYYGFGK